MALTKAKLEELIEAGDVPTIAALVSAMLGGKTLIRVGSGSLATAGGTPNTGSATVGFGETFSAAPIVLAVSNTGRPEQRFASASEPSTTGMTVTVGITGSTSAATIAYSWIAIGTKA